MGFMRLTPLNAKATRVAGVTAFVRGGTVIFLVGAFGLLMAAVHVTTFAWEQVALMLIGAAVVAIGRIVPKKAR